MAVVLTVWFPASLLGGSWASGLALAMAVSMSSTAVVLQILQTNREMQKINGRLCVAVSIVQDLLSLVFMAVLPVMAKMGGMTAPVDGGGMPAHGVGFLPPEWPAWLSAVAGIAGIAGLIVIGRRVMPLLLREASRGGVSELPLVISAAGALIAAGFAAGLGFSPELGAFLAGFLLANTPFRHQLAGQLSPMRDLFMAIFFTAVGLKLQLAVLPGQLHLVIAGLIIVLAAKSLIIALCSWIAGATAPSSVLVGLTLCQAGEFTIVVMTAAAAAGLVSDEAGSVTIAIVVLSLMLTPSMYNLGKVLGPRLSRVRPCAILAPGALTEAPHDPDALAHVDAPDAEDAAAESPAEVVPADGVSPEVAPPPQPPPKRRKLAKYIIIAGYGVVGRSIADRLAVQKIPFCIVDMNRQTVETQRKLHGRAYYGDISNPEVLESAGIEHADAVLLTIPDDDATLRACTVIRNARPDIFISARTSFLSKAFIAQQLGADHVVVEEVATAEMMAREVMARLERRAAGLS
jgi:Kef-type K+ transport system membrane component KefB